MSGTKDDVDYFSAVQLTALNNVLKLKTDKKPSNEYYIRRILRYYSQKFYTPLHEVSHLPLHHVLQAYFEHMYEELEDADLDDIRIELLKSEEQRLEERRAQDDENVDLADLMEDMTKEAEIVGKKIDELQKLGQKSFITNKNDIPMANPLLERQTPPQIKINFLKPNELNEEGFGLLDEP